MIALDANTALRSFRDGTYDLVELATGLAALLGNTPAIHLFKYADGTVQPMAPAALFHDLITSYPYLVIGNAIGIAIRDGGVSIECASAQCRMLRLMADGVLPTTLPDAAQSIRHVLEEMDSTIGLQARIDGSTLEYTGESPVPMDKCHIGELTVEGLLTVEDAGDIFENESIGDLTAQNVSAQGEGKVGSVNVESTLSLGDAPAVIGRITMGSLHLPSDSSMEEALSINTLRAYVGGSADSPAWFGWPNMDARVIDAIRLTSGDIRIQFAALMQGEHGSGEYTYCIPYTANGITRYLPVSRVSAVLSSDTKLVNAPNGMTDFLIWPSWAAYSDGTSLSFSTYWQARVLTDVGSPYPIVTVRNVSDAPINNVAIAWSFGRDTSFGKEYGAVSVLRRVTLPPCCSVEFLFSYNGQTNVAYMSPTRAL